jgi:hypothetical protein
MLTQSIHGGPEVQLNPGFDNLVLDASSRTIFSYSVEDQAFLPPAFAELILAGVNLDIGGSARLLAHLDPFGEARADLGASEAYRFNVAVANGVVSDDPSSPYAALHDVVGSATTLHAPSARFDGAVVVNFGADDSLAFEDAFSPAGFAYAGGFLTYDADGDGTVEATVLLTKVVLYFQPVWSLVKMDQGFMSGC